jgi:hypothetical protein
MSALGINPCSTPVHALSFLLSKVNEFISPGPPRNYAVKLLERAIKKETPPTSVLSSVVARRVLLRVCPEFSPGSPPCSGHCAVLDRKPAMSLPSLKGKGGVCVVCCPCINQPNCCSHCVNFFEVHVLGHFFNAGPFSDIPDSLKSVSSSGRPSCMNSPPCAPHIPPQVLPPSPPLAPQLLSLRPGIFLPQSNHEKWWCFASSVLQALSAHTPLVQSLILVEPPTNLEGQFFIEFSYVLAEIRGGLTLGPEKTHIIPQAFMSLMPSVLGFPYGSQECSLNFLTKLVDKLDNVFPLLTRDFLGGISSNNFTCGRCSEVTTGMDEHFVMLQAHRNDKTLEASLKRLATCQTHTEWRCESRSCLGSKDAAKSEQLFRVRKANEILIFQVGWFEHTAMNTLKKGKYDIKEDITHFSYPLVLDMHCLLSGDSQRGKETLYDLFAVTVHTGTKVGGGAKGDQGSNGHYVAFVEFQTKWSSFNDLYAPYKWPVEQKEALAQRPFFLFYRRRAVADKTGKATEGGGGGGGGGGEGGE